MPAWNADVGGTGDESELRGLRAMGDTMATSLLLLACCSAQHSVSTTPGISPFMSSSRHHRLFCTQTACLRS